MAVGFQELPFLQAYSNTFVALGITGAKLLRLKRHMFALVLQKCALKKEPVPGFG